MAETYNEDVESHLIEARRRVNNGINTLAELLKLGEDLTAEARRGRIAAIRDGCVHSPCPVVDSYQGNPRPEPVLEPKLPS